MRIITGSLRGRRLRSPTWPGLRPTSDRLRETLFNILRDHVPDADVLDACAGTGALGFEAISRGATHATFVDRDARATELIAEHASRFGVGERCTVVCGSLPQAVEQSWANRFTLALVDPPYETLEIDAILSAIAGCLTENGLLVLEGDRRAAPRVVPSLTPVRRVVSGGSSLDLFTPARPLAVSENGV